MALTSLEDLTGRHGVIIGQSLIDAWNERSGKSIKRSKGYPNPEFYSLRYSFKPESIDPAGHGTITPKAGEGHAYELERPSTKGGVHRFSAVEQRSKDWECILLWDPETRTLNLERLESTLNLTFEGQGSSTTSNKKGKATASRPVPAPAEKQQEDEVDAMTRALIEELEEEEKVDDFGLDNVLPSKQEEEPQPEREEVAQPLPPPPPPLPAQQPKDKAATKPAPKAKAPKAPAKPKPKPKPKAAASKKGKEKEKDPPEQTDLVAENPDEEELSFGQRSRPVQPRRQSSDPAINSGWAFPAVPSSQTPPVRHAQPIPSDLLQPPSSSVNRMEYESDSDPEVIQGEALNEDLFAHEIEEVLARVGENEDEEPEDDFEPVPIEAEPTTNGRLLTMNELMEAKLGARNIDNSDDDDDDDDSSSDDTDSD